MPTFVFFDYNKKTIDCYQKILENEHKNVLFYNGTLDEITILILFILGQY